MTTNMTENGLSTTKELGEERYEKFYASTLKKMQFGYDYRHTDGELFSTVRDTLEECRMSRDEWLAKRESK